LQGFDRRSRWQPRKSFPVEDQKRAAGQNGNGDDDEMMLMMLMKMALSKLPTLRVPCATFQRQFWSGMWDAALPS
jgi:hypothetical protein